MEFKEVKDDDYILEYVNKETKEKKKSKPVYRKGRKIEVKNV